MVYEKSSQPYAFKIPLHLPFQNKGARASAKGASLLVVGWDFSEWWTTSPAVSDTLTQNVSFGASQPDNFQLCFYQSLEYLSNVCRVLY